MNYLNKIIKNKLRKNKKKFFTTDGKILPFKDNYFDFIISAQVIEHLTDSEINTYYSEEERTLKENGLVYHELPHKLMLYDSHSRFWLLHLFPYFCKPFIWIIYIFAEKTNLFHKGRYYADFSKTHVILECKVSYR